MLCTARRIEEEGGFKFSWFIRTRPEFFWYSPPPADFASALWKGRNADSPHTVIWDETWWKMNDAIYAVHSSLAEALWSQGPAILTKIKCFHKGHRANEHQGINPEMALLLATEHVNAREVATAFGMSARPLKSPGTGQLYCKGGQGVHHGWVQRCEAASRLNMKATSQYRQQVQSWISSGEHEHDAPVSEFGPAC